MHVLSISLCKSNKIKSTPVNNTELSVLLDLFVHYFFACVMVNKRPTVGNKI